MEGEVNDRGKRMGDWYLERMTLKDGQKPGHSPYIE